MRVRELARRSVLACGALGWAWATLHGAATYFALLRRERDLRAEALWLLSSACDVARSAPMSGELLRCDDARAIVARWPRLVAGERAAAAVLRTLVDGARREIAAALRALGALGLLGWFGLLAWRVSSERARDRLRVRYERDAVSPLWRSQRTTVVPIAWDDHEEEEHKD